MKPEAIEALALERAMLLSIHLEDQLDTSNQTRPMIAVLALARDQAALAMKGLIYEDPTHTDKIREFQFEIRRYDDLVAWMREIIIAGKEADRKLSSDEREEFARLLNASPGENDLGGTSTED